MDLARPIRSVIPSLDGPVLEALARSAAPATLTKVHARAGEGSVSGVRNVLERLVEHGVVTREPGGYVLNRKHLATCAIEALAGLHGRFASRIREWVAERPEPVVAVGVYGSMARRDGAADSDIDILVVTSGPTTDDLRTDLASAVAAWTGNPAQVAVFTRDQIEQMRADGQAIVESWEQDLQLLVGNRSEVLG